MTGAFRFEYPWFLLISLSIAVIALLLRYLVYNPVIFHYALTSTIKKHAQSATLIPYLLNTVWIISLVILALLVGKPQWVDQKSKVLVDGIDIMLVLDASGSMQLQDFSNDRRTRFDIAKEEAIRFLQKRTRDAMGLVFFAKDAFTRLPLTNDQRMLKDTIDELQLGDIAPDGTMLGKAMLTAINRLKHSKAKSKIMIVLTDGEPSPGDIDIRAVTEIAKKFSIKIYTIGIGSEQDEVIVHPLFGLMQKPKVNTQLLQFVAKETNGQFFLAHNADDMREIYNKIDALEKTEREIPFYSRYIDVYVPWLLLVFMLMFSYVVISSIIWFSV